MDGDERQELHKLLDWSFARGEDIVYGAGNEGWLVLPRSSLEEQADMLTAINHAKTWGEARQTVPAWCFDEIAELMAEAGDFDEDGWYAGLTFESIPDDHDFDRYDCRAYDENGIPRWRPDSLMAGWMPSDILDEYGLSQFDLGGSEFHAVTDIDGLLDGLRSVGATCERDDKLVDAAFNGR